MGSGHSAQYFYETLVPPLSADEREALWQDYIRFGELFGLPRSAAPASYAAFRAYWDAKLASDEVFLTDEARQIGYATAFEFPLPRTHQLGKRIHDLLMLGSLGPRVREVYGLPGGPRHDLAFRAVVRSIRAPGGGRSRRRWRGAGTRARSNWSRGPSDGVSKPGGRRHRCGESGPVGTRMPEGGAAAGESSLAGPGVRPSTG